MWLVISLPTVGGGSRPHQPTYHLTYLEMRSALHGTPPPTPMAFNDRGRLNDKRSLLACFLAFLLSCSASLPANVPDHPPRYCSGPAEPDPRTNQRTRDSPRYADLRASECHSKPQDQLEAPQNLHVEVTAAFRFRVRTWPASLPTIASKKPRLSMSNQPYVGR